MTNVKFEVKNDELILTVDLKQDHGKSKSGKTTTIASTHGFAYVEHKGEQVMFSVNVNRR